MITVLENTESRPIVSPGHPVGGLSIASKLHPGHWPTQPVTLPLADCAELAIQPDSSLPSALPSGNHSSVTSGLPAWNTAMTGPSDFHITGRLRGWDVSDRLGEVRVPTLVTSGRYDEATPGIARTVAEGIAGSEWTLFERSAHMPHLEETGRYLRVLDRFLRSAESPRRAAAVGGGGVESS